MFMKNRKRIDHFIYHVFRKIDRDVLDSFSHEELSAIKDAIRASFSHKKQRIDIRGTIDLFLVKFYYVFFAGREGRISRGRVQGERRSKMNSLGNIFFIAIVLSGFILLIMLAIYGLKILF